MRYSILFSSLAALATAAPLAQADEPECDRQTLLDLTDDYIASQYSGTPGQLGPVLSPNFTYIENNSPTDIMKGVPAKALKIDHERTNVDMLQCATYTELIASDPANPYVIGTQLHLDASRRKILKIDSVASTTGAWLFDAKKTLQYVEQEKWDPIPASKHDSREAIQAAGDAWMDMWSNATAVNAIPFGTPCTRLEGSAYTGKGQPDDSCRPGIPTNHNQKPNTDRRYVIDQDMGSVSILCVWQHMMNAADSHEFRLENGKLRYVHTITVCPGKTCRL